jgi:hypothetical protein
MDNKIEPISIEAELILAKARIHLVMQNILQITKELDQRPPIKTALKLYDEMILADLAIDRNIAKIEFVTRRESSLQLKRMRINRINYA